MCGRRGSERARHGQSSSGHLHRGPSGWLLPSSPRPQTRGTHPRRSSRISAMGTIREHRDTGAAGTEAIAVLQSCAPDGGGAALPGSAWPLAVCQSELSGRLCWRLCGRGRGSPWETGLLLVPLTIAPPTAGQSDTADTGAGRSELGWRVTTGARWVPEQPRSQERGC